MYVKSIVRLCFGDGFWWFFLFFGVVNMLFGLLFCILIELLLGFKFFGVLYKYLIWDRCKVLMVVLGKFGLKGVVGV